MRRFSDSVYERVKRVPWLKVILRNAAQLISVGLSTQSSWMDLPMFLAPGYFFGFHDKCPWDRADRRILAHSAPNTDRCRRQGKPIEIGYFGNENMDDFRRVTSSRAWNWQQGTMLQWDPAGDGILFNEISSDGIPALAWHPIAEVRQDRHRILGFASAAISECGSLSAAIDFVRFGRGLAGYGYSAAAPTSSADESLPSAGGQLFVQQRRPDGLFDTAISVTYGQCLRLRYHSSMDGAYHFFSHPQFSPDSATLAFYHRWRSPGRRVETTLFFLSISTGQLTVAQTGTMVSHYCWLSATEILAFYERTTGSDGYGIIGTDGIERSSLSVSMLPRDGHPNCHLGTGRVVTDTYPNERRLQSILLIDAVRKQPTVTELAKLYAPFRFQETFRADLHPRWNRRGDRVAVDCSFPGRRSLAVFDLSML